MKIVLSPFNSTSASVKALQSVRFLHIPRETNSVADQPAKDSL